MRKSLMAALILAASLFLGGCGHRNVMATPLKVGIIPYDKAAVIREDYSAFASYLGKKCGRPDGEVFVTPDYAGILTALRADQIDCAYLNPLSYVLALQEFRDTPEHLLPLAMPYYKGSLTYRGVIFVRADSGIKTLQDLRGKSFAFNDRTSTSGYLYPSRLLLRAGIDPTKDLKPVNISGTGPVLAVLNGTADAGAGYEGVIQNAFTDQSTRKPDVSKIQQFRILAYTEPIPNGMIVVRGNLDPTTLNSLRAALVSINTDPAGKAALVKVPWNKVVPAQDAIFTPVRDEAKLLGLNLQALDAK